MYFFFFLQLQAVKWVMQFGGGWLTLASKLGTLAMGGVENLQWQHSSYGTWQHVFLFFFLHSVLSVLFPAFLMISAAAVRGVHRRQRPFHQVADGERPGPDHLLRHRGELQGGCKQDCMVFVSLLLLFSDYMLTEKWFFFSLMPDWLDWTTGELRRKKPPHNNWWTNKSHTCVERHLLHPQILFRCPLWLPALVWFQQKSI